MKNHPKLENIPVLIMRSDEDKDFIKECKEAGAVECLMKPIRIKDVKNLEKYLKKQEPED